MSASSTQDQFEGTWKTLQTLVDPTADPVIFPLHARRQYYKGCLGGVVESLRKMRKEAKAGSETKACSVCLASVLDKLSWKHLADAERQWLVICHPPAFARM